jgi:hypothetical protein
MEILCLDFITYKIMEFFIQCTKLPTYSDVNFLPLRRLLYLDFSKFQNQPNFGLFFSQKMLCYFWPNIWIEPFLGDFTTKSSGRHVDVRNVVVSLERAFWVITKFQLKNGVFRHRLVFKEIYFRVLSLFR